MDSTHEISTDASAIGKLRSYRSAAKHYIDLLESIVFLNLGGSVARHTVFLMNQIVPVG